MMLYDIKEGPCSQADPCIKWYADLGFRPVQMAEVAGGNIIMIKGDDSPLQKMDVHVGMKGAPVNPYAVAPLDECMFLQCVFAPDYSTSTGIVAGPDNGPEPSPVPLAGSGMLLLSAMLALIIKKLL